MFWAIFLAVGYFPADRLAQEEVKAYREKERRKMSKVLDEYVLLCQKAGVCHCVFGLHFLNNYAFS